MLRASGGCLAVDEVGHRVMAVDGDPSAVQVQRAGCEGAAGQQRGGEESKKGPSGCLHG